MKTNNNNNNKCSPNCTRELWTGVLLSLELAYVASGQSRRNNKRNMIQTHSTPLWLLFLSFLLACRAVLCWFTLEPSSFIAVVFFIFSARHTLIGIYQPMTRTKKKQILTGAFMAKGTSCTYTYIRGTHFAETLFYLSLTKYEICAERLWWVSDLFHMTCSRSTGQNLVKYCFVNKRELIHINRIFDEVFFLNKHKRLTLSGLDAFQFCIVDQREKLS